MNRKRSSKSDRTPSPQLLNKGPNTKQIKSLKLKSVSGKVPINPHRKQNSMGIVVSPPASPKSPNHYESPFAITTKKDLKKSIMNMGYQRSNPRVAKQKSNACTFLGILLQLVCVSCAHHTQQSGVFLFEIVTCEENHATRTNTSTHKCT